MLLIGAATSKRLNIIILFKQIKNYTKKKSCGVATPGKKRKILTTSSCNLTVALKKIKIP